jgi:hypothetical protein
LAVASLMAVVLGGLAVASAGTGIPAEETIVALQKITKAMDTDLGKPGPTPGDELVLRSGLFDEAGAKLGTGYVNCRANFERFAMCSTAFFLSGRGEVVAGGAINFGDEPPQPFDVPVTGGTGEFENVRGSIHAEAVGPGEFLLTFHLIP